MAWIHDCFIDEYGDCVHDSQDWGDVEAFDNAYEQSNYWWTGQAVNDYIPQWNNACAIWLLINRCNYLEAQISGAEITMSAILDAMYNAEPHQPLLFMGLVEAYKTSVWNARFDEHYFADLVKKWSIWE